MAWCPDWPVVASGMAPDNLVAVVEANRVVACSIRARTEGVRRGLRRREAQARCPELEVVTFDPGRDARAFEGVVGAVEAFTTGVEIIRPGVVAFGTRGPSRYFGGDLALAAKVVEAVDTGVAKVAKRAPGCRVGVADGRFAAEQAARLAAEVGTGPGGTELTGDDPGGVLVVPPGESGGFLAPLPISALPFPQLTDLLRRLGITTLGVLTELPAASVLARFGPDGDEAHRLAQGLDDRPLAARTPPQDLAVSAELDPPAERVDTAAFVAKALADRLHARLAELGLACTRVAIEAETEHGEHLARLWRHDGALDAGAIAERVRWQLDGWLSRGEVTGGLTLLRLVPDEVRPDLGRQLGFWGRATDDEGMSRTLARLQGILGPEGVVTAVLGGGRDHLEQVRLVPWGDAREPALPGASSVDVVAEGEAPRRGHDQARPVARGGNRRRKGPGPEVAPWPGRVPGPAPAVVHVAPLAAEVRDGRGVAVTVSGRGAISAAPAELAVAGGPWQPVEGWAGPWPLEERWWEDGRRRARFQVVVEGGHAYLLVREAGCWWIEATYD